MKIVLVKQSSGELKPYSQEDMDMLKKYPIFHKFEIEIKEANRSLEEHRMFWSFLNFLFENQSYTENKDKFRAMLLLTLGYTEVSYKRLGKGKYEEIEVPMSLSFDKMSQKKFHNLFTDLQKFSAEKLGISFDDWKHNEWKDPNSCMNPDCHNPATDVHEIIPGSYRRQWCIDNGLQVKICRSCHSIAHGKHENIQSGYMSINMWEMLKIFCKVLNVDVDVVRKKLHAPSEEIPFGDEDE